MIKTNNKSQNSSLHSGLTGLSVFENLKKSFHAPFKKVQMWFGVEILDIF